MDHADAHPAKTAPRFLADGGEMGQLIRERDWSRTPLGPVDEWSPSLRMIVGFMLTNRFPMLLWWGPDYISLYNDPYRPVLGAKHPSSALGLPARECWSEIWHVLKPLIDTPFHGGPSTWTEDLALNMNRHGFFEETHFTVAYSPVPDETAPRGIGGVMATVHEITDKIIGERQVATLRELAVATANAHSAVDACKCAADALRTNPQDVPFAMIYLADSKSGDLLLAGSCGIEPGSAAAPLRIGNQCPSPWPASDALRGHAMRAVPDLAGRFGKALPVGAWEEPPHTAALVPIQTHGESGRICMLVVGLNPFRLLAGDYQRFLELAAREIGAGIANAVAYEEERRRAEALAEIDRAKTAFFSNVSHEFRTPLSLILGPLEDALQEPTALAGERLELVHRNALRLLKLVNSLLDFSRIEAGRMQARFQPIELAHFTAELASNFKSATQRAGLALTLDCEPLPQPVYVDREMWEKIILNLVSNAFKFTLDGGIEISMHSSEDDQTAELRVHDTGSGIPEEELPRLFERFHRVENTRGRSFEGSGIGLALVRELVKQHGGSIAVESKVGRGTTFTVSIPFGKAHLPPERITEEPGPEPQFGTRIGTYVDEALRWLPDIEVPPAELQSSALDDADGTPEARAFVGKRVLLADDNLDMREYITRLLRGKGYVVEAVSDGAAALATIAVQRPDLVLSDVMMPRMDGFELLAALRDDPKLRDLPVIMLSARAGEEARVEGLAHGADDYLSKPFSARELLARVCSNLHLAGIRQEVEADLRQVQEDLAAALTASDTATYRWNPNTGEFVSYDNNLKRLFGFPADEPARLTEEFLGRIHPDDAPAVVAALDASREGADFEQEYRAVLPDQAIRWIYSRGKMKRDAEGKPLILVGACTDITGRKLQEEHREMLLNELNHRVKNTLAIVQSVAMQTLRVAPSPLEARESLDARLVSLARAHDILTAGHWSGGDLKSLVVNGTEPYTAGERQRFLLDGPDVHLRPKAVLALAMALHELSTNAVKYGALSNEAGQVRIVWEITDETPRRFRLTWREADGPAVGPPCRRGFGSRLIEQGLAADIRAGVVMDYAAEGLRCMIEAPLSEISGAGT